MYRSILLLLGAASFASAAVPVHYSTRASYTWTENYSRSSGVSDFRDVGIFAGGVTATQSRQVAANVTLRTAFDGDVSVAQQYSDLHEITGAARISLERKFGLGRTAPVLAGEIAALGRLANLAGAQGVGLRGRVNYFQRFNDTFSLAALGELQQRWSKNEVFDLSHARLQVVLNADPTDWLRFSVGASRQDGLFVAGASGARFAAALAGALGPVVQDYFLTLPTQDTAIYEPNWVLYRVRGEVDAWWFELAPALGQNTTLALRFERVRAENVATVKYRQNAFSISLLHAF